MSSRARIWSLVLGLAGLLLLMVVLLAGLGGGFGTVELLIRRVVVAMGVLLVIRRFRKARPA